MIAAMNTSIAAGNTAQIKYRGAPMKTRKNLMKATNFADRPSTSVTTKKQWGRAYVGFAFVVAFTCVAQNNGTPGGAFRPEKSFQQSPVNAPPDANTQMETREKQGKQKNFDAANAERKKQIADDSTKLLTMALALKAEVDKTTKDTLSLSVIRRADEIEKLAHNVKEKMKLTVGPG
jgi:hypothetical protein